MFYSLPIIRLLAFAISIIALLTIIEILISSRNKLTINNSLMSISLLLFIYTNYLIYKTQDIPDNNFAFSLIVRLSIVFPSYAISIFLKTVPKTKTILLATLYFIIHIVVSSLFLTTFKCSYFKSAYWVLTNSQHSIDKYYSFFAFFVGIISTISLIYLLNSTLLFRYRALSNFSKFNLFSNKIKLWWLLILIPLSTGSVILFSLQLCPNCIMNNNLKLIIELNIFLITILIFFRPKYLDKIINENQFNILFKQADTDNSIDELTFFKLFIENRYFLSKDASLSNFSNNYQVNKTDLETFLSNTYQLSFSEIINKFRVEYFIQIAKNEKYSNYSIESMAKESGFKNRQSFYLSFKKYHGGNPSDLLK